MSLATNKSESKLICYFSSHPAAFRFWSSTPLDNITLILTTKKADQSLSEFQTGIGVAAHVTLGTEQPFSCTRVAHVDTISPLQDSEGAVISVSIVHQLLNKIHDSLHNAMSKWIGNTAHILAHVFNLASRQHCEVWASQFPFFTVSLTWFLIERLAFMAI